MGGNIAFGKCADYSHRLRPLVVEAGGNPRRVKLNKEAAS